MAADDANRFWADPALRERFFDIDPVTGRYRRFFDIDDLAGVRQEDPGGLRGRRTTGAARWSARASSTGCGSTIPTGSPTRPATSSGCATRGAERVWVEKILESGERLRDWPVSGTVGYEFLNDVCGAVRRPGRRGAADRAVGGGLRRLAVASASSPPRRSSSRCTAPFAPEVERLARELGADGRPAASTSAGPRRWRRCRSTAPTSSRRRGVVAEEDRARHRRRRDGARAGRRCCCSSATAPAAFVTRFQQTTPAVMAKGVEDTAFYRYARLLALNDVGGDPGASASASSASTPPTRERARALPARPAHHADPRHQALGRRARADRRAGRRCPDEWAEHVRRWLELDRAAARRRRARRRRAATSSSRRWSAPGRSSRERVEAYMEKALREAKRNTNWVEPERRLGGGGRSSFCRAL